MKDESLLVHSLASFSCFTYRNLFQNGANDMSEMLKVTFCQKKKKKPQNFVQFELIKFVEISPAYMEKIFI